MLVVSTRSQLAKPGESRGSMDCSTFKVDDNAIISFRWKVARASGNWRQPETKLIFAIAQTFSGLDRRRVLIILRSSR